MQRLLLKSKLHRARVTGTEKDYEGSIAIDAALLDEADIAVGERVQVVNVTNGERFETYTIEGEPGQVEINGAAARLAEPGDVVIVISSASATRTSDRSRRCCCSTRSPG